MKRIEKKHIILSVAILLVIIIGVTYAYWTAIIEGVGTPMVFETEEYKIVFTDSEFIDGGKIQPGWSYSKTFTVESKSTVDFKYNIVLEDLINTFKTDGSLQYKITSTNGYNMNIYADIPKSEEQGEGVLAYNVNISPKDTHTYTLELIYQNKEDEDQSIDMGSVLSGKIGIKLGTEGPLMIYSALTDGSKYKEVKTRSDYSTVVGDSNIQNDPTSTGVIYKTANESEYEEGEEIYYFAGNPSDNWVKFGKETKDGIEYDIYWRIIRTNHDKSVRLLYAGNTPETTNGYIGESEYNPMNNDTMYVGWEYGTTGSLANNRTRVNSSTARDTVLEWYNTNIKTGYEQYISKEAIYCNDRSGDGYVSSGFMHYAGSTRLVAKNQPTYQCGMNTTGGYTNTSGTWISGGTAGSLYSDASDLDKFKDGVGLMTVDEATFAGGVHSTKALNTYYYRNSKESCSSNTDNTCSVTGTKLWWTMSPNSIDSFGAAAVFCIFGSDDNRSLDGVHVTYSHALRPVLSLKANTLVTGSGTATDPYVLD